MALTYGFYNSIEGDRKYNAKQFGAIFDGVIHDGVYSTIGNRMVVQASGNGFQVNVQTGRAWFNHTWTLIDAPYSVTLPSPEPLLDKYVAVCLEMNEEQSARRNSIVCVSGTPGTKPSYPTLINTGSVHQIPLAYCLVKAGKTSITQAEITNMVGTSSCPYVTGVATSFNIDELIAQWASQWNQFLNGCTTEFNDLMSQFNLLLTTASGGLDTFFTTKTAEVNAYIEDREDAFEDWFENIKGQLTEDAATHLQLEIDEITHSRVILTDTLTAGSTSISFTNMLIDDDCLIDVYTDSYGVNPTAIGQNNHTVTLTFAEQQYDVGVKLVVRKEATD